MRREKTERGVVIVHERGDGIRRRFRESLDESRYAWPRKGLVHHTKAWFASDAPLKRPLFGVYAFAALAEDLVWKARFGRRKRTSVSLEDATILFAATRRALQNVLSSYPIDGRLTPRERESLRRVVARLRDGWLSVERRQLLVK